MTFLSTIMDILGPFFKALGKKQCIIVAIGYFTKLVEIETIAEITTSKVISFS
jgi:hypothetical protein